MAGNKDESRVMESIPNVGDNRRLTIRLRYQFKDYETKPRGYYLESMQEEVNGDRVTMLLFSNWNAAACIEQTLKFSQKRFDQLASQWPEIGIGQQGNIRQAFIAHAAKDGFNPKQPEVKADETQD